jgi:hypothetical protein
MSLAVVPGQLVLPSPDVVVFFFMVIRKPRLPLTEPG